MKAALIPALTHSLTPRGARVVGTLVVYAIFVSPLVVSIFGCAVNPEIDGASLQAPTAWSTTLPQSDSRVTQLSTWWDQFDDPTLAELIRGAQAANPRMTQALARVEQSRALARAAGASQFPSADISAGVTRSKGTAGTNGPALTTGRLSLDALWEIDLFGRVRNNANAAETRADVARLQWHDARVSLAAEVAQSYVAFRSCELLANVLDEATTGQSKLAELTRLKVEAGFESPANGALSSAAVAESNSRRIAQRAECEIGLRQLSVMTTQDVVTLRSRLSARTAVLPRPAAFQVANLPAEVLAQRPDLAASERELRAAAYDVSVTNADRYPRLTLLGSIGSNLLRVGGNTTDTPFWSIGPSLTLPLFDAGRRAAQVDAARARLAEARATHEGRLRAAVGEVEQALIRLDSASRREADAEQAARGYGDYFSAARERWRLGAGSQIELEDARRLWLNAQTALLGVQYERVNAWIALYKAVGGGWNAKNTESITATRTLAQNPQQ